MGVGGSQDSVRFLIWLCSYSRGPPLILLQPCPSPQSEERRRKGHGDFAHQDHTLGTRTSNSLSR